MYAFDHRAATDRMRRSHAGAAAARRGTRSCGMPGCRDPAARRSAACPRGRSGNRTNRRVRRDRRRPAPQAARTVVDERGRQRAQAGARMSATLRTALVAPLGQRRGQRAFAQCARQPRILPAPAAPRSRPHCAACRARRHSRCAPPSPDSPTGCRRGVARRAACARAVPRRAPDRRRRQRRPRRLMHQPGELQRLVPAGLALEGDGAGDDPAVELGQDDIHRQVGRHRGRAATPPTARGRRR